MVKENQKIPISNEGHIFDGWTFNGTIPGPTMRVTQGDHVRIKVINSPENQHATFIALTLYRPSVMDGVSMVDIRAVRYPQEDSLSFTNLLPNPMAIPHTLSCRPNCEIISIEDYTGC